MRSVGDVRPSPRRKTVALASPRHPRRGGRTLLGLAMYSYNDPSGVLRRRRQRAESLPLLGGFGAGELGAHLVERGLDVRRRVEHAVGDPAGGLRRGVVHRGEVCGVLQQERDGNLFTGRPGSGRVTNVVGQRPAAGGPSASVSMPTCAGKRGPRGVARSTASRSPISTTPVTKGTANPCPTRDTGRRHGISCRWGDGTARKPRRWRQAPRARAAAGRVWPITA